MELQPTSRPIQYEMLKQHSKHTVSEKERTCTNFELSEHTLKKVQCYKKLRKTSSYVIKPDRKYKQNKKISTPDHDVTRQNEHNLNSIKPFRKSKQKNKENLVLTGFVNTPPYSKLGVKEPKRQHRNPLARVNSDCHLNILKYKSKRNKKSSRDQTFHELLQIPKHLKLNNNDLKLKSSYSTNTKDRPENNVNERYFMDSDEYSSLALLKKSFNTLSSLKKNSTNLAEEEASSIFDFPQKSDIKELDTPKILPANESVREEKNSNIKVIKPTLPKTDLSSELLDITLTPNIDKCYSNSAKISEQHVTESENKSLKFKNKTLNKSIMEMDGLGINSAEEAQFLSPVLGSVQSTSKAGFISVTSVLNSNTRDILKSDQCEEAKSRRRSLSPLLSNSKFSFNAKAPNFTNTSAPCNVRCGREAGSTCLITNSNDTVDNKLLSGQEYLSPVLDLNEHQNVLVRQKINLSPVKLCMKSKQKEAELPSSPVLHSYQFKKTFGTSKPLSINETVQDKKILSTSVLSLRKPNYTSSSINKANKVAYQFDKCAFNSMASFDLEGTFPNKKFVLQEGQKTAELQSSLAKLDAGCFLNKSKLHPAKEIGDELSPILGYSRLDCSDNVIGSNSVLENKQNSSHNYHAGNIYYNQDTPKVDCVINGSLKNYISTDRENVEKFLFSSSQMELNEFCSPVLDSSKFKVEYSRKKHDSQNRKDKENKSKGCAYTDIVPPKTCDQKKLKYSTSEDNCKSKMPLNSDLNLNHIRGFTVLSEPENKLAIPNVISNHVNMSPMECHKNDSTLFANDKSDTKGQYVLHPKYPKRPILASPEVKLEHKKLRSDFEIGNIERFSPVLGQKPNFPADNEVCLTSNLCSDTTVISSPSFNSEFDIRKFPIMFCSLSDHWSPKQNVDKVQTGKDYDISLSSQKYLEDNEKEAGKVKLQSFSSNDLNKPTISKYNHSTLLTCNNAAESSINSPVDNVDCQPHISFIKSPCNKANENPCLKETRSGTEISTANYNNELNINNLSGRVTKLNKNTGYCGADKRHIKKNLALYYVDNEQASKFQGSSSSQSGREILKDKEIQNEGDALFEMSGIEKILDSSLENAEQESHIGYDLQKSKNNAPEINKYDSQCYDTAISNKFADLNKNSEDNKVVCKRVNIHDGKKILWKNQMELFDVQPDIFIEDFDEESPFEKENCGVLIDVKKLESVKRNLDRSFGLNTTIDTSMKPAVHNAEQTLPNFETENQNKNNCEDLSSDNSVCEVEIHDELSQKSERTPAFKIEYSTSPITKSSEETQNEVCSERQPLLFPPALYADIPVAEVLDSACKTRRPRIKKGSLAERLRRLVRGQRAEVNMFHYEATAQTRARARACTLRVSSSVQTCSRLVLSCRYVDAHQSYYQEFGSGEEVVDPEVRVYVDPSFQKNIIPGSIVMVFPPWHSVWCENRAVVLMYCVTKVRVMSCNPEDEIRALPLIRPFTTATSTTVAEFSCQIQDEQCACRSQLVGQLFSTPVTQTGTDSGGAITSALAGGWYPYCMQLRLTVLHSYWARVHNSQVQCRVVCMDDTGQICQLILRSKGDILKLGPHLQKIYTKTFLMEKLSVCARISIDRCKGLRSFLSHLHPDSSSQMILYVATPSSDQWTAQLVETSGDSKGQAADQISSIACLSGELPSLPLSENVEARVRARVKVMAVRRDELYAWEPQQDSYFKMKIASSAAIPDFPARAWLDILYIWANRGELTIDKFTEVSVVEAESENYPNIPPLRFDSVEGNLVLLDSVVTNVSSDACVRWEGSCGHKLLRVQKTTQYFCVTCRHTLASGIQKLVLEVSVVAVDIPAPVRLKVKSETARVLLGGTTGQISSEKSYNMIGVIGSTLKCLAIVSEVLKNSFGDIIEFCLEEL